MTDVNDRAKALYSIRMNFGWSPAVVAEKLDVSPRMVGMWETGSQEIPDGRWRLFIHEVNAELERNCTTVVVVAADGVTPIDAVSDSNFYSLEVNDFDGTAVISSYAIDRRTQRPYLHTQRFRQEGNEHVLRSGAAWQAGLSAGVSTGETEMLTMHRWLTRRVLEAERHNPRLRELKDSIAAASNSIDQAPDEATKLRSMKALDQAVFDLLREVELSK